MKEIVLQNGLSIPSIGLGANGIWGENQLHSELAEKQYNIYRYAMDTRKCKLYDTSGAYGYNEEILGEAIQDTNCRKDILIMTKISNSSQRTGNVRKAIEDSLKRLKTDYIDIYLIHWPQTGTFVSTWLEMEKMYHEGIVKAIGVCNFNIHHLEELMKQGATIMPMLNEFELHPLFTQDALVNYCYAKDIKVIAYSPIARMHDVLIKSKPVYEISRKYKVSPVQVILKWHYQRDIIAIPRTTNIKHLDEFFDMEKFELTDKEIAWISSLNENIRLRYNPDTCDFYRL